MSQTNTYPELPELSDKDQLRLTEAEYGRLLGEHQHLVIESIALRKLEQFIREDAARVEIEGISDGLGIEAALKEITEARILANK